MTDAITVTRQEAVQVVRIDRAEKMNALTAAMYDAMTGAVNVADEDDTIAATVILGAPGVFTAGNDIADFVRATETGAGLGDSILGFLRAVVSADRPLIAGVDGLAVGIGATLLLHCDYVVASPRSTFRTPFVNLGLVPEAASSLLAPRLMGHRKAFELLVMGHDLDAASARDAGLVNVLVEPVRVEETALAAAGEIAAKPREAMLAARRLMKSDRETILARIDAEAALFEERLNSPEAQAAFSAFITRKRAPPV